jgi:hypothetical protein
MNIGIVRPIRLFTKRTIPGTIKTTQDAYNGWRQHLKIPSVTSSSALYAYITVTTEIIKNGTPTTIRIIPRTDISQYGTKFIWKTGWR